MEAALNGSWSTKSAEDLSRHHSHLKTCSSGGGALGSPAFYFTVLQFSCYFSLVSGWGMAVSVQFDLLLTSAFSSSMAGILLQVIIVILIVIGFLKRH